MPAGTVESRSYYYRNSTYQNKKLIKISEFSMLWLLLLLPLGNLLLHVISFVPNMVESLYSRKIYVVLSGIIGRFISIFPFSIATLVVFISPILLIIYIILKSRKKEFTIKFMSSLVAGVSVLYFVFVLFCGPNYHRLTFAAQSGLQVRASSTAELVELCSSLVQQTNALREKLPQDDNGVMVLSDTNYIIAQQAQKYYSNVAVEYPALAGYVARPKPTNLSSAMSFGNISGIYIAHLFEPNVNVDMVDYNIPVTMMHEMSHFKGYMREDEANFIAYLACKYSDSNEFIYSGNMLALIHSTNALYDADKDLYAEVISKISDDVMRDLVANDNFWKSYEGPVAEASTAVNDIYLKTNMQQSGVKSYGEMVDLLLAENRR